jgi:hypothetical protein
MVCAYRLVTVHALLRETKKRHRYWQNCRPIKADPLKNISLTDFSLPGLSDQTGDWYDEPHGDDTWYAYVSTVDVAIILEEDLGLVSLSWKSKIPGQRSVTEIYLHSINRRHPVIEAKWEVLVEKIGALVSATDKIDGK